MGTFDTLYADATQKLAAIIQPAQDSLDAFDQAAENEVAQLNATLVGTQANVADLQAQLDAAKSQLDSATAQIVTDTATMATLQAKIAALTAALGLVPREPYAGVQEQVGWESHVGTNISGSSSPNIPTAYGFKQLVNFGGSPNTMSLSVTGGAYGQWLAARHIKPIPAAGKVYLAMKIQTDANAPNVAQAIEIDTRISKAGWNYNLSSQINYHEGGMLQVSAAAGGWVDTGIVVGKLTPGVWHSILWEYVWDDVAKLYSHVAFSLDGVRYPIPAALQNLAPQNLGWGDGLSIQLQQTLGSAGGSWIEWVDNLDYEFPA